MLREAEKAYYARRFNFLSRDKKRDWQSSNDLLSKSSRRVLVPRVQAHIIANEFNEYLVEHPPTVHNNIAVSSSNLISIVSVHHNNMIMHETTKAEASNTIRPP